MRTEIKKIHQRVQTTIIYVTHDQVEAMTLADRIVVMNNGRLEQVATPQEMYDSPATRFVAGFIGSPTMNFIRCQIEREGSRLKLNLGDGFTLDVPPDCQARYGEYAGRDMLFGIRPEHITEKRTHTSETDMDSSANVEVLEPLGVDTMVFMDINGQEVCGRAAPYSVGAIG